MPPRLIVKKRPVPVPVPEPEPEQVIEPTKKKKVVVVKRMVPKKNVVQLDVPVTVPVTVPVVEAVVSPESEPKSMDQYLITLTDRDRSVMAIASEHLGTSFCLEKSVGFVEYML